MSDTTNLTNSEHSTPPSGQNHHHPITLHRQHHHPIANPYPSHQPSQHHHSRQQLVHWLRTAQTQTSAHPDSTQPPAHTTTHQTLIQKPTEKITNYGATPYNTHHHPIASALWPKISIRSTLITTTFNGKH